MLLTGPLLAALMSAVSGSPSGSPVEGVAIPDCDFGEKYQLRHVTCDFVVSNENDTPRTITAGKSIYPSDTLAPASVTVAAHGTATLKATMERLGVIASYSRPRVSDDIPDSESLFRTLKYRPKRLNPPKTTNAKSNPQAAAA